MATSSKKSAAKGKREPEDDLETKQIMKKHKEKSDVEEVDLRKKKLFVACLSPQAEISHIISFFKCVGDVVSVRLILNRREQHVGYGFVDFASVNEAKKALKIKNGEYLHGCKIFVHVAKISRQPRFCIDHKVWYEDYIRRESLLIEEEGLIEEVTARKNTLFVANLSPQTKISHINNFFNYVGKVVSVRLIVNHEGKHVGYGFVEFSSANEAKKVLELKNGEYLHDHKIFLYEAKITRRPMYNLAEKLWYEDCVLRESLLIEEEDETFERLVAARKKFLFVANLSPQTKISHIINFFNCVGKVVSVRLITNHEGKHVGSGFVEFASANEAKKVLETKNGEYLHDYKIYLDAAMEAPYPQQPKYCIDHKVWYEDYLRRESLLIEEEEEEDDDETFERLVEEVAARKKTLFVANLSPQTKMVDILNLFKIIGQVANVRFIVNDEGKHVGCGFVEFLRADKAKRALKMKNGEYFHDHEIFLDVVEIAPYPLRPKYNRAEERYESLLKEEEDLKNKTIRIFGKKTYFVEDEEVFC